MRLSTNIYLEDSMPFFVDLTKNGNLSFLVTSTSPPLLSMTPKWIAARQILDCWNNRKWTLLRIHSLYNLLHDARCLFSVGQTHHIIKESSPNLPFLIQTVSRTVISAGAKTKSELILERWMKRIRHKHPNKNILTCCRLHLYTYLSVWSHT